MDNGEISVALDLLETMTGTAEQTVILSRLLGALAAGNRPFKIFNTPRQAHHWLALLDRRNGQLAGS